MAEKNQRSGLLGRLSRRIFGADDDAAGNKPAKPAADPDAFAAPVADNELMLTLGDVLREEKGRFSTKIHVVSLIEFREAVGEKWDRLVEKVMMIADAVIKRHIGGGRFARQGNDFFLLIFPGMKDDEARSRAISIAQELGRHLLGSQFSGGEQPLALSAEMLIDDVLLPDGSLDHAAVDRAVAQVRALIAAEAQKNANLRFASETDEDQGGWAHLKPGQMRNAAEEARRAFKAGPVSIVVDTDFEPVPEAQLGRLGALFRPTWMRDGEIVGAFLAQVRRRMDADEDWQVGACAYLEDQPGFALTVDRMLAHGMADQMAAMEKAGHEGRIIVPISFTSLIAKRRMQITGPYAELPDKMRARRLMIEIFGIPDGVTERQLTDAVSAARALSREVAVRVGLSGALTGMARDCGAAWVGADLAELQQAEKPDDDGLSHQLDQLQAIARRAHLHCYVWGIRRRLVLGRAVMSGFAMANGAALMKEVAAPSAPMALARSKFANL